MEKLDENTPIIRYMDINKFLSLIEKKALYFSRFEQLDDVAEGFFPFAEKYNEYLINDRISNDKKINEYLGHYIESVDKFTKSNSFKESSLYLRDLFNFIKSQKEAFNVDLNIQIFDYFTNCDEINLEEFKKIIKKSLIKENIGDFNESLSEKTIINCWNLYQKQEQEQESESDGMWKLYSSKNGIAIKATAGKLENLSGYNYFKEKFFDINTGKVEYYDSDIIENLYQIFKEVDFENKDEVLNKYPQKERAIFNKFYDNLEYWFFIKRNCFKHEDEIRAVISPADVSAFNEIENHEQYIDIGSLNDFIDEIIISPYAEKFTKETVKGILSQSGDDDIKKLAAKVRESDLKMFNDRIKAIKDS